MAELPPAVHAAISTHGRWARGMGVSEHDDLFIADLAAALKASQNTADPAEIRRTVGLMDAGELQAIRDEFASQRG